MVQRFRESRKSGRPFFGKQICRIRQRDMDSRVEKSVDLEAVRKEAAEAVENLLEEKRREFFKWIEESEAVVECFNCGVEKHYVSMELLARSQCCGRPCVFGLMKDHEGVKYYGYGTIGKRVWAHRLQGNKPSRDGKPRRKPVLENLVVACECGTNHKTTICILE